MSTSHDLYEQLAVGHALSALEPEDEQLFLAHLPTCAACQRALVDHEDTLVHLAYAADAVEPPPALLDGIMAGVASSGRAGSFPAPVVELEQVRARRAGRTVRATTAVLGAAASFVLVAALLVLWQGERAQNSRIEQRDVALNAAVSSLVQPSSRKVDLTGSGDTRAVAVVNGSKVSLVLQGVDANDASDSVYVLWQRTALGDVAPVGTFDVGSDGVAVVNGLRLKGDSAQVTTLMVTEEKGRTAPRVAAGSVVVSGTA